MIFCQLKKLRLLVVGMLLISIPTKVAVPFCGKKVGIGVSLVALVGSVAANVVVNKVEKACQEFSLLIYFLRNAKSEKELLEQLNTLPKHFLQRLKDSLGKNDGDGERPMTNEEIADVLYNLSAHPGFQLEKWFSRDEQWSKKAAYISLASTVVSAVALGHYVCFRSKSK